MRLIGLIFLLITPQLFGNTVDQAVDQYWGARRKIAVIQEKTYTKDGKVELTLSGGIVPNDNFFLSYPLGGRLDYFLSETFSLMLGGAYHINADSQILNTFQEQQIKTDFVEKILYQGQIGFTWSMLYGKLTSGGSFTTFFDIYTGLYGALYGTEYHIDEATGRSGTDTAMRFGGGLTFGMRLFLAQSIDLKLEMQQGFFSRTATADGGQGGIQKPFAVTLGLGILF